VRNFALDTLIASAVASSAIRQGIYREAANLIHVAETDHL
jgi:hypothetical protein